MADPSQADAVEPVDLSRGEHFSCVLSAVLLARVREFGGAAAVQETVRLAGSAHSAAYLTDIANWISYDEAVALWAAGTQVTHHPAFARAVGQDSVRRMNGSPVATMLRSLGTPESVYRQIAVAGRKYSSVTELSALDTGPGYAHLQARPYPGFPRSAAHCEWTVGLLSCLTELFGLPAATVAHDVCSSYGAPACVYEVTWPTQDGPSQSSAAEEVTMLRGQLEAMGERLQSMFQTAGDLIGNRSVDDVLARIAGRAAVEVRAPRHLLAVRLGDDDDLRIHQAGFAADELDEVLSTLLSRELDELPDSWLAAPIRSNRRDYGMLLAAYPANAGFLSQERELFEVYAGYAASALDSADALLEAEARHGQSSALLALARALSAAGTSAEVAQRVANSVPIVVDCDHVAVYVYNGVELVREAVTERGGEPADAWLDRWPPHRGSTLERLLGDPRPDPIFIGADTASSEHAAVLRSLRLEAAILVPLVTAGQLIGMLAVAVRDRSARLRPSPDLLDRLSGVGAQAATALQNGRLLDLITHRALHDELTGLANRGRFTTTLRQAIQRAELSGERFGVLYLDLDAFKPVNDEFGHEAGDVVLVAAARRLQSVTRANDLVGRLGGDEFAVLVADPGEEALDAITGRIMRAFDEPFEINHRRFQIGISIGRAVYPADGLDADRLLRCADQAMFIDKRGRRESTAAAVPTP